MAEEQKPNQSAKPKAETLKAVSDKGYNKKAAFEQRLLDRLKSGVTQQDIAQKGVKLSPSDLIKAGVPFSQAQKQIGVKPTAPVLDMPIKTAAPKAEYDVRYQEAMNNTINAMATEYSKNTKGMFEVKAPSPENNKGSVNYNYFKDKIEKEGKQYNGLVITKGADGKPYLGTKRSFYDSMVKGFDDYHYGLAESNNFISGDAKTNKQYLEYKFNNPDATKGTLPVYDKLGQTVGGMGQTMMDVTAATLSLSEILPNGAIMFGAAAPDAVKMKYGESLKDYYNLARAQGLSPDDAYSKANSAAKQAAGWEVANQAAFAATGGIGMSGKANLGKALFSDAQKESFAKSAIHHLNNAGLLTASAGLTQAGGDIAAESKGIKIPDKFERSLSKAEDMFIMDIGFKAISGITQVPKAFEAQAKSLVASVDKATRKMYASMKEASGEYPAGTGKTVEREVSSWKSAESKTPDIADEQRKTIIVGLTEKLTKLEEKQDKLADIHKETLQPEIDDIKSRIKLAQVAKDPLVAEVNDDGTPLIKTEQNATPETQKPVQEGGTTSGVSEYQGTETVQTPEAVKTDNSNRPVVSEEEKVSIADKIRKFKIDESVLTGGEKGAMQSNIAGLPIAIYNASVEAIALSVEAGESLVSAIDKQIEQLKKGGHKFNEEKFKNTVSLIDKANNNKAKLMAEAEMQGIKSSDYTELQRFALEKYNQNDIYKNPQEMAKSLRAELSKKMDTSGISDDVFEMIGYDAVLNQKESPFVPGAAKRIVLPFEKETDPMRVSARDAFKGVYTAAETVGKSIKERASMAGKAVKEALKGQGLDLDENALTRSINRFITSKMDTDTAMQTFMDNLDDIIGDARDVVAKGEARKSIKSIIKNSKNDAFSTVAIKDIVNRIDWISPSKIDPEKLSDYNRLLEDFNKSITGQIPDSETARQDLIDFTNEQRAWSDNKKQEKLGDKYDKLVEKGEINANEVSKEEYVAWNMNPDAQVSEKAQKALSAVDESEATVMRDLTDVRQQMLTEAIDAGEIDAEHEAAAKEVAGFDVTKVSAKNIKLLNNIIEDIMSGERPSRIGEIATDIGVFDAVERMKNERVRSVSGVKTMGGVGKIRKLFGWQGSEDKYKLLGLTNIFRQIGFNERARAVFRSSILGDFPSLINSKVINKSKQVAEDISNIYTSGKYKASRLVEKNDYRIGLASTLMQYDELYPNLETIKNSLITLSRISKDNSGEYTNYVNNTIEALKSFDLIDNVDMVDGKLVDITFKQGLVPVDLILGLNDRELAAYEFGKKNFAELAPELDNSIRDVYGVSLDYSNENYIPLTTFFTGDNKVIELEDAAFGNIPSHVRTMRSGTTFERQPMLVGSTLRNGKDVAVHYDFRFMKNYMTRYHESLNTAHTARSVKQISKLLNSQGFSDVMSGAYNVEPSIFHDNTNIVNGIIEDYVNKKRSPYQLSAAQVKERSGLSKFLYSRLLHSWGQLFKQSIPSTAYLLTEGNPIIWINSHKEIGKAMTNEESRSALKEFLNHTSQTDRVAGGLEIFAKDMADLDASDAKRLAKSLNHKVNNITGAAFEFGDKYTTINALLVGYMKGLNKFGKLDSYSSFDLISEIKKGLDKDALAYAENFMSQVNSESGPASKAKVLRQSDAPVTRMLQSYALNQWVNFNIDAGVAFDKYSTTSDRLEAGKRLAQYAALNGIYAMVASTIIGYNTSFAKWALKKTGVQLADDNPDMDAKREETNDMRTYLGTLTSMMLGGANVVEAQGAEFLVSAGLQQVKKYAREQKEKMGESVDGTWMAPDFNFVYKNGSMGVSGAYFEDAEKLLMGKQLSNEEQDNRIKSQRDAQKAINEIGLFGTLLWPSPDMAMLSKAQNRVLRDKSINQNENLAALWHEKEFATNANDRSYWEGRYAYETRNIKNLPIVEQKTIMPLADKMFRRSLIMDAGKRFDRPDNKVSDILYNISGKSGETMFKIINNRYAGKDMSSSDELRFMIQYGGITPEDYALSIGMDNKGKPIIGFDLDANWQMIQNRFIEADKIAPTRKNSIQPGSVGSAKELAELYAKYANMRSLYEESQR